MISTPIIIGITGQIATGKTTTAHALKQYAEKRGVPVLYVNVDTLRRHVLIHSKNQDHHALRQQLIQVLNLPIKKAPWKIPGELLGNTIFNNAEAMTRYRDLINPTLQQEIAKTIQRHQGLILVEWALLEEDQLLNGFDHQILTTTCTPHMQETRLTGGDLPFNQVKKRILMQKQLTRQSHRALILDTSKTPAPETIEKLFKQLIQPQIHA
jgi:dephospho-CoA kinase